MAARDRDGVGHHVESTFVEVALNSAAQSIIEAALTGEVQGRVGNRDVVMAPQGLYASEEDEVWVAISVATDDQWQRLLEVIGSELPPAWHASERMAHHDEIDTDIERWTRARGPDAVVDALVELDVPVGAVRDPRLIGTHPQLLSRGFFERSPHPVVGDVAVPTLPFRFTSVARWLRRPAPVFGQDNVEILSQLGYGSETIDEFARDGVIASRPVGL
jgi:crotonobetainyl-CoA:carnitine CoA-transferase CaiB-like acyl-CoA transferase